MVALTACCLALAKGLTRDPARVTPLYASMLCACGLAAANVASLLLGTLFCMLILAAFKKFHILLLIDPPESRLMGNVFWLLGWGASSQYAH